MDVPSATEAMIVWLVERGLGEAKVSFRLRDWLFSRQRYWGEPFPVVYDTDGVTHALPDSMLPVTLPDVPDFSPRLFEHDDADSEPEAPLGRNTDWVNITLDLGDGPKQYRRDTNTMPNWAGSCWYYLRYLDPESNDQLVPGDLDRYWMGPGHGDQPDDSVGGVDLYVGGVEHAVLHLLYARFWHQVLYDLGHVSSAEPFYRLFNQGFIQACAYTDERGVYVPAEEVVAYQDNPSTCVPADRVAIDDKSFTFTWHGETVQREYGKMGKSLKNAVTPDEMYAAYGADTLRVYEMSMGPLDLSRPWDTRSVAGSQRFLQRLWRNVVSETTGEVTITDDVPDPETLRVLHRAISGVTEDLEAMRVNTAIAKLIVLNNHLTTMDRAPRAAVEPLVLMTAPVAPHLAEELWEKLGHDQSLTNEPFPVADSAWLVEETVTCVIQVAGKVRSRAQVSPSATDTELTELALADPAVVRTLAGRDVRKVIVRAPGLVNVVPG
jgi:leucyl-tRNA synthetase